MINVDAAHCLPFYLGQLPCLRSWCRVITLAPQQRSRPGSTGLISRCTACTGHLIVQQAKKLKDRENAHNLAFGTQVSPSMSVHRVGTPDGTPDVLARVNFRSVLVGKRRTVSFAVANRGRRPVSLTRIAVLSRAERDALVVGGPPADTSLDTW